MQFADEMRFREGIKYLMDSHQNKVESVIEGYKELFRVSKSRGAVYEMHPLDWKFIQVHFKEDLLKIPESIYIHKAALPIGISGIYQIYDMKGKQLYFYLNPDEIQYQSIRFLIDNNKQMLATVKIRSGENHSTYQLYQIGRDIDNNLTLIKCER